MRKNINARRTNQGVLLDYYFFVLVEKKIIIKMKNSQRSFAYGKIEDSFGF